MAGGKVRWIFFVLLFFVFVPPGHAGEYTVFGPQQFVRGPGKPAAETVAFKSPAAGSDFTLKVRNGGEQANGRVSSGEISLNGKKAAGPSDFNQRIEHIRRQVSLAAANELSILLAGKPGSFVTVAITGEDNIAPVIDILEPTDGSVTGEASVTVRGTVIDQTPLTVTVNGLPASLDGQGFFAAGIPLAFGENTLTVAAADLGGNTATSSVTVIRQDTVPPQLAILAPAQGSTTELESITVSGTVTDDSPVTVLVNGLPAALDGQAFSAAAVPLAAGENTIAVVATDAWGNSSTVTVIITRQAGNPAVAPQPEGSFGARYQDLIPLDAVKTSYDPKRFALITGQVNNLQGNPVPDVTVSVGANSCIQCHGNQYGSVKTNSEGRFTIPVEGGATTTVVYQKSGLITSHRQVYVPWNDIAIAETVRMIPEDAAATIVTFDGNPQTVITHQSTEVADAFGRRAATLVFTGDNKAYEVDAGGGIIRELATITVRATEFPTPESMPAKLPPASAFTYCVELGADGVERVRFDKPVTGWVDNFLGFEVGETVPVGYYDRDRGVWVPADNGVVVMLLDTDGDGVVDALDADGDNFPNDLNGNGAFNDEVKGLEDATKYQPGATFWRFAVTHFTPWDCNWPYGPPEDAISPNPEGEPEVDQQLEEQQDCSSQVNSFVEDRSRIFHEDISIPGTDLTLHYASDRIRNFKTRMAIPASGQEVPGSLKRIIVRVEIAGRTFGRSLDPLPNQEAHFLWDGLDHLGRRVFGAATARVSIGFVYDVVYYSAREDLLQAFARAGDEVTGIRGRGEIIFWQRKSLPVQAQKANKNLAEGWTVSNHHELNPNDPGILYKGDGFTAGISSRIIDTVAGDGSDYWEGSIDGRQATQVGIRPAGVAVDAAGNLYLSSRNDNVILKVNPDGTISRVAGLGGWWNRGYWGDGGLATSAKLNWPSKLAMDAAGNLFIADTGNNVIRKVDAGGIITTIAGNGYRSSSGDGGPATRATLLAPRDVAVDAVGNIYILEYNKIRKVDVSGTITTVAGDGISGYGGDGGPAVAARFRYPEGIGLDAEGDLYVADFWNYRVRKVDAATGVITTVAGNGTDDWGYTGDGGPATKAPLHGPAEVVTDAAGNLYILEKYGQRARRVDTGGIISTVAGGGTGSGRGDGGPATEARFNRPEDVAVDAAGDLYIADYWDSRVRKVAPIAAFRASVFANETPFAEANGLGHVMTHAGLHQRTVDLDTGVTLSQFGYDGRGRLSSIADRFGNTLRIERDARGLPVAIISPDGLTTALIIDGDNRLTRIIYPDASSYRFEYTPDGLMTAEIDPNGNHFEHIYDEGGRIVDVFDPEGGRWHYQKASFPTGESLVQKTTGEDNVTTYRDHTDATSAATSTITGPSGGVSTFTRSADGLTETASLSCGMEAVSKYGLDPEYKFKFVKERTESTPAGRKRLALRDRTYLDTSGDNIPDRITEKITVNGKATTLLQEVLQAKKEATSPTGRKVTSFYDPASLLTKRLTVSGLYDVTYGYDAKGRLTTLGQGERQSAFAYTDKGFLASVTDPENRTITYDHDLMGRVTVVHRPDGSSVGFAYDNNGNMTVLTNPASINHDFTYDGNDIKTGYQAPQSGSYRYFYDKDRRLVETLFPSGKRIRNLYANTQLTQIQTPEGDIDLDYLCSSKLGSMSRGGEKLVYDYDGKLITSETLVGTLNQSLSYSYNNDFNVTSFTYAGGTVSYTYDNDGLLTGASDFTIARNAGNGLPESVTGGSFNLGRTFNGYGEVAGETTTIGGAGRYAYSLTRSASGRITGKTENVAGEAVNYNYTYDDLGRLRTVTKDGALVEEYRYDANGRRSYEMNALRGIAGRTFAYSSEDHLLFAGDVIYQYDLDGFLASKTQGTETTSYNYSSRGELLSVTLPDGKVIKYVHDPQGRSIAKKVNGVIVEKYLWQGLTRLLAVYDGNDNLVMRFLYADGRMPMAMSKGGIIYHFAYDQVGTLRAITDAAGNVVKKVDYDSFGNILADSNSTFTVPFGFAGGLHDRDAGLVRFGFRDYISEVGRWSAKDPIGFAGRDIDLFGYVQNDPINLIDPPGLITAVITVSDYGVGTHSAVYVDNSGSPAIYDPAGSYGDRSSIGSGDLITGSTANLNSYANYHLDQGSRVSIHYFNTTAAEEASIFTRAVEMGGGFPGFCALRVSDVIHGIGPFEDLERRYLPDTLYWALSDLQEQKRADSPCN